MKPPLLEPEFESELGKEFKLLEEDNSLLEELMGWKAVKVEEVDDDTFEDDGGAGGGTNGLTTEYGVLLIDFLRLGGGGSDRLGVTDLTLELPLSLLI